VAAHYGSFIGEQRTLVSGDGFVDLSHRDVVSVSGPDRLTWLHSLTTQYFLELPERTWTQALILSPQGHVEHAFAGYDTGSEFLLHTEPGQGAPLVAFLDRMRFLLDVAVADVSADWDVVWRPGPEPDRPLEAAYSLIEHGTLAAYAAAAGPPCGLWAFEALRIARGVPRLGIDTDHRTIPNELGLIGPAVHLDKGCYRGQETVARVHTLGRPPRRLTLLHLDGTMNALPAPGSEALVDGKAVGFVGSSARHHELGPIALALLKRNVPVDAPLLADGIPASQEVLVDPEVGLHVRPRLR